jgi:hypothetical protein
MITSTSPTACFSISSRSMNSLIFIDNISSSGTEFLYLIT